MRGRKKDCDMDEKVIDELKLRLQAPIIAMERIAEGSSLPQVFVDAALSELKAVEELLSKLKK